MSASSGSKRRRRRQRRIREFCELTSTRTTMIATAAACGLLLLQAARVMLGT
jgi:hypothetical protein